MLDQPIFNRLKKAIQKELIDQKEDPFVAITSRMFSSLFSQQQLKADFKNACTSLGLVDDRTGYNTFTLPGQSILNRHNVRSVSELEQKIISDWDKK